MTTLIASMREYLNILREGITDAWFQDAVEAYKNPIPISFETAETDGQIETLEGPVDYKAGDKIITGVKGEKYPVGPETFAKKYNDNGDGTATPKKIILMAKLADHDGAVTLAYNGSKLNYTAGEDYIVQHGPGDYGVVKKDVFAKTYRIQSQ